jgi:hypothetical protein
MKIFRSVIHPKIALGQPRLTPKFFTIGLPEKKVYVTGMSILSILLSLEPGCHNSPLLENQRSRRSTPSQECPILAMSIRPNTSIHVLYVQLVTYIPYHVPLR